MEENKEGIYSFFVSAIIVSIMGLFIILYHDVSFSLMLFYRFIGTVLLLGLMFTPWVHLYRK